MLEVDGLVVQPWTPSRERALSAGPLRWVRQIGNAATGDPVGFATRRAAASRRWFRWLAPPVLEIYEHPDASLLFMAQKCWGPPRSWEVNDAEGHRVGVVRIPSRGRRATAPYIEDRYGRLLARQQHEPPGSAAGFIDPEGSELGTITPSGSGWVLRFHPELAASPFVRMLLLAATLAIDS